MNYIFHITFSQAPAIAQRAVEFHSPLTDEDALKVELGKNLLRSLVGVQTLSHSSDHQIASIHYIFWFPPDSSFRIHTNLI